MGWQVLARTLQVDYRIPKQPSVSPDVVNLLGRLLVLDPLRRLDTKGVMQHPWFTTKLPRGVDTLNQRCLAMKVGLAASGDRIQGGQGRSLQ